MKDAFYAVCLILGLGIIGYGAVQYAQVSQQRLAMERLAKHMDCLASLTTFEIAERKTVCRSLLLDSNEATRMIAEVDFIEALRKEEARRRAAAAARLEE